MKTALFQIKRSQELMLDIEKRQLKDAHLHSRIAERSFVLAVDEVRATFRITPVADVLRQFGEASTRRLRAEGWLSLAEFIWKWLACELGPHSQPDDPQSVEALLRAFVVENDEDLPIWDEYPEDVLPSRTWLDLRFVPREGPA
ncbi:hypothetical protein [Limnochorda pilosa]|nr:hypothetical protein [Limnochorda pilosa]